jgi:hypothetical protein
MEGKPALGDRLLHEQQEGSAIKAVMANTKNASN